MKRILIALALAVFVLQMWMRLAPSRVEDWHVDLTATQDRLGEGDAFRIVPGSAARFERLDMALRALPRTRVLAGDVASRHITYVTRSLFWGFPDYTTIQLRGDEIALWGRLRFGRKDFGVNAARLEAMIAEAPT